MRAFATSAAEGHFGTGTTMVYDHPDSTLDQCVTRPTDFLSPTGPALYIDQDQRLYRPRVGKTEDANQALTVMDKSERVICLDVYIPPISRQEKIKNPDREKAGRLVPGDIITLTCRRVDKSDLDTVREFTAEVVDVSWGEYHNTPVEDPYLEDGGAYKRAKRKLNDNLGVVRCNVHGSYARSLVVDPASRLRKRLTMAM